MSTVLFHRGPPIQAEIERNPLQLGATDCTEACVRAARGIWPDKTAEHWAAAAGVKPRMAKYWLAGHVSDRGRITIIKIITD